MDNNTFDQVYIDRNLLGDSANYIKEGVTLLIAFENGESAITAAPPTTWSWKFSTPNLACKAIQQPAR
jgi:elongation factor P